MSREAEVEEIRKAYRSLAIQNHPDRVANLGPEFVKVAEEKFKSDPAERTRRSGERRDSRGR